MLVFPAQQTSGHRAAKVAFGLKPAGTCGNHEGPLCAGATPFSLQHDTTLRCVRHGIET